MAPRNTPNFSGMDLARMNLLPGWVADTKFGRCADVQSTSHAIWPSATPYTWRETAGSLQVSSSSTSDTADGTGARTVRVFGLDANFEQIEEDFTLNGQTAVVGTKSFYRVNRAYVLTAGTGETNAGDIWVSIGGASLTSGVPADSDKQAVIDTGSAQTEQLIYTVPRDYVAHVSEALITPDGVKDTVVTFWARTLDDGVFRIRGSANTVSAPIQFDFTRDFPAGTDIEVRAVTDASSAYVSAYYNFLIERVSNGE